MQRKNALSQIVHLIHLHQGLIFTIDRLVSDETSGRDHGLRHTYENPLVVSSRFNTERSHTVSNEQDDILGYTLPNRFANGPSSDRLATLVVLKPRGVFSWFVK